MFTFLVIAYYLSGNNSHISKSTLLSFILADLSRSHEHTTSTCLKILEERQFFEASDMPMSLKTAIQFFRQKYFYITRR